ncbi:uncharacterized protein RJT20DRAFT_28129 [Scheffersomyces xylosifermentans]|uniref:uncharacterized protein n=1 Tax=Scheffersomyces xylosifermentans TaxID=1304137 RepID=UPI00315CAB44
MLETLQDHSSTSSIVLGCSVAVISSGIQSLGITLQRKSHLLHITLPTRGPGGSGSRQNTLHYYHHQQKYKRNMWLFGFMLFIVANILGSLIQITTLPLIILSPLQSIGLIFNSILSCLLLPGENFTNKLGIGTVIIAICAFIIAYNGNVPPEVDEHPPKDTSERFSIVMDQLLQKSFLLWFIFTFILISILLAVNKFYLNKKILTNKESNNKNNRVIKTNKYQFAKGINYGIISGTLTAHTFLFAKSIIDVIFESIIVNHSKVFPLKNMTPYILLLVMLSIIGCQLTAFNLGLAQISTSILYPLCFLVYNLINLINDVNFNSLLLNHRMSISQFLWILVGLVGVLCGVVIISWDSAFGTCPSPSSIENDDSLLDDGVVDDGDLMFLKFPYTHKTPTKLQDIDEHTKLLQTSTTQDSSDERNKNYSTIDSTDTNYRSTTMVTSTGEFPDITVDISDTTADSTGPKRVLSFEQSQLLHSIDIQNK